MSNWRDYAACDGMDLYPFFGGDAERGADKRVREAEGKAVCRRCEVRGECLAYALSQPERWGIWGGLNEDERHTLRRNQQRREQRKAAVA